MKKTEQPDNGGPAFPIVNPAGMYLHPGMTMLDWFAGMALQGLLASENSDEPSYTNQSAARMAYLQAIEMVDRRDRLNSTAAMPSPE